MGSPNAVARGEQGGEVEGGKAQSAAEGDGHGEADADSKARGKKSKETSKEKSKDKAQGKSKEEGGKGKGGKGGAYTVTDYVRDRLLSGTADLDASEVRGAVPRGAATGGAVLRAAGAMRAVLATSYEGCCEQRCGCLHASA
jgi:hypothetical protein